MRFGNRWSDLKFYDLYIDNRLEKKKNCFHDEKKKTMPQLISDQTLEVMSKWETGLLGGLFVFSYAMSGCLASAIDTEHTPGWYSSTRMFNFVYMAILTGIFIVWCVYVWRKYIQPAIDLHKAKNSSTFQTPSSPVTVTSTDSSYSLFA
jgi:hypothetical protein